MTLLEMSPLYRESAALLYGRIGQLRAMERDCRDGEEARQLRRRIETLRSIWRETQALALLTAHYHETRRQ